jgi:hypothetical protein
MTPKELLSLSSRHGVVMWTENGTLRCRGRVGSVPRDLKRELASRKLELADYLKEEEKRQLWVVREGGRTESFSSMADIPADAASWCRTGDTEWTPIHRVEHTVFCGWFRFRGGAGGWRALVIGDSWTACRDALFGRIDAEHLDGTSAILEGGRHPEGREWASWQMLRKKWHKLQRLFHKHPDRRRRWLEIHDLVAGTFELDRKPKVRPRLFRGRLKEIARDSKKPTASKRSRLAPGAASTSPQARLIPLSDLSAGLPGWVSESDMVPCGDCGGRLFEIRKDHTGYKLCCTRCLPNVRNEQTFGVVDVLEIKKPG